MLCSLIKHIVVVSCCLFSCMWESFPLSYLHPEFTIWVISYTAVSRKVVGKSTRNHPERYCGWFWVHCSSKKIGKMAREVMDSCLKVVKESNKTKFDSYIIRNSVLIIGWSHIPFGIVACTFFSDNLSRNSCISIHVNRIVLAKCYRGQDSF